MPTDISICTMNVLNLAAAGQTTHNSSRPLTEEQVTSKVGWISEKLKLTNADLYAFQEVWHADTLKRCFAEAGLDSKFTIVARDASPGKVEVAAAFRKTKFSSIETHWIEKFPDEVVLIKRPPAAGEPINTLNVEIGLFSRPVLQLKLRQPGGQELIFASIHMKSKLQMDLDKAEASRPGIKKHQRALGEALSTIRRTAEVAALRVHLNNLLTDNRMPVIVAGDLNDGHLSTTAQILSAQPPVKLFEASTVGSQPTKGQDVGLYSAQMLQEYRSIRDVYYTYEHQNILESLDHIFVSEEFYQHSPARIWAFRELVVLNDHIHTRGSRDKVVSDHGIIVARFDHAPAGTPT